MVRAKVMIVDASGLVMFVTVPWPECRRLVTIVSIRSIHAVACVRKYFVAASMDRRLCCFINTGMTVSMFILKPIQTSSQCELIIRIRVSRMMVSAIAIEARGFINFKG